VVELTVVYFFVPFRNKYLDHIYIMRNGIKINRAVIDDAPVAPKEAPMELYFSPMACSLATRIALYEAGAAATYFEIDPKTKLVRNDGSDFRKMSPTAFRKQASAPRPASNAAACSNGCASSAPNCTRACSSRCSTRRRRPR
jgi:hypothetical protein